MFNFGERSGVITDTNPSVKISTSAGSDFVKFEHAAHRLFLDIGDDNDRDEVVFTGGISSVQIVNFDAYYDEKIDITDTVYNSLLGSGVDDGVDLYWVYSGNIIKLLDLGGQSLSLDLGEYFM